MVLEIRLQDKHGIKWQREGQKRKGKREGGKGDKEKRNGRRDSVGRDLQVLIDQRLGAVDAAQLNILNFRTNEAKNAPEKYTVCSGSSDPTKILN